MSEPEMPRLARYFVTRGWLHVVLLTGVGIFMLPFLWLVATSLKSDDELTSPGFLPSIPRFVPASPYVLPAPALEKPLPVEQADWDRNVAALRLVGASAIEAYLLGHPQTEIDRMALIESASAVLVNRLAARINTQAWNDPGNSFGELIHDEAIASAIDDRLARLELRGVQLQTLDGHIEQLCDARSAADFWQVESGSAKLMRDRNGGTYLQYRFDRPSDRPIVLKGRIPNPPAPADRHRFILSLKPDDSWHRISASVYDPGAQWSSDSTNYLAQNRATSIFFQYPSYEDRMLKPH